MEGCAVPGGVGALLPGLDLDAGAVAFIEQNEALLRPAFAPVDWTRFLRYARSFAFADAQALLPKAGAEPQG